jgi:hypothetical protein
MKLKTEFTLLTVASIGLIALGVAGIAFTYASRSAIAPGAGYVIPVFLLVIGVVSGLWIVRGLRGRGSVCASFWQCTAMSADAYAERVLRRPPACASYCLIGLSR